MLANASILLSLYMTVQDSAFGPGAGPLSLPSPGRQRDFRLFWLGETVSLLGTQITALALPLIALELFNATAEQVGLLRFLQLVPYLVLAVFVGVLADRVRRRPVMLAANALRLLLLSLVPALFWLDHLTLGALMAITLGVGVGSVLFDVTWMAYVPTLVGNPRHYVEASSKLSMSSSAADIAGPGLAGVLLSFIAAPLVLLIDAASYLVSLAALSLVRVKEAVPSRDTRRSALVELRAGLQLVFGSPVLRALAIIGAFCNFSMVSVWTVFLIYASREVGLSPHVIGAVFACASLGGLLGAGAAGRILRRFPLGRVYAVAQTGLLLGPWLIVLGSSGGAAGTTVLSVVSFFVTYLGLGVAGVIIVSLRQASTPEPLMARMTAVFRTLLFGGGALGGLAAGFLTGNLGGLWALATIAIGSTAVAVVVWLSPVRRVPSLPAGIA